MDWADFRLFYTYKISLHFTYINSLLLVELNIFALASYICSLTYIDYLYW